MQDLDQEVFCGRVSDVLYFLIFAWSVRVDLEEEIKNQKHFPAKKHRFIAA